jgi:hypothetical protein
LALFDPAADNIVADTLSVIASSDQPKRRRKKHVPEISTAVRRCPRNHAAGFKVQMPTDSKKRKPKVKARVILGGASPAGSSKKTGNPADISTPPIPLLLQFLFCRRLVLKSVESQLKR